MRGTSSPLTPPMGPSNYTSGLLGFFGVTQYPRCLSTQNSSSARYSKSAILKILDTQIRHIQDLRYLRSAILKIRGTQDPRYSRSAILKI